jgi:hypothetical protein
VQTLHLRRMIQLCKGRRILASLTCLGLWLVAIVDVRRFGPVRRFWTLGIDSCMSGFCLSCDLRVAELFILFSLLAERFSPRIPSVTQSLAKIVGDLMLAGSGLQTLVLLVRIRRPM